MKKILTILLFGIVAMSTLSCTSKLEKEISELKEQLNSRFEFVVEKPNIIPAATLQWEQSHRLRVPYSLKGATGKVLFTARCESEYGNVKAYVEATDENGGFVNIAINPYESYFEKEDGFYMHYSKCSVFLTATDERGRSSVQIIRIPGENFFIPVTGIYKTDKAAISVGAEDTSLDLDVEWSISGEKEYFPELDGFKLTYPFDSSTSTEGGSYVVKSYFDEEVGKWDNLSRSVKFEQKSQEFDGHSSFYEQVKYLLWEGRATYTINFDKNKSGTERVVRLSLMKILGPKTVTSLGDIYIVQQP